jgi:protein CpxP
MTTFRKNFLSALAALSLGAAAFGAHAQAQALSQANQGRYGHAVSQEQRAAYQAKRAEFAAKRVARLHDELKITPAQENAWNAFVASMKPQARGMHPDRAAQAGLTAPQRLARHIEGQKQRTAAMEQRLGAVNSFYAVLSPEQKKTFDDKAARLQGRIGKHGGRGGWQHRGEGDSARG